METKRIVLHASHTADHEAPNLEQWLRVNGRKLGLLDIGYHYVVFKDGAHLATRPHDRFGSHTPGFNKDSIGIVLQGGVRLRPGEDGEELRVQVDNFTDAQMETLRFLVGYLTEIYGELELVGHTELGRHQHRLVQCPPLSMERIRQLCQTSRPTTA